MVKSGIYNIVNLLNYKIYVGSAVWFNHRWRMHKSDLNLNKHCNKHLQKAWNKYGKECFSFEILEIVIDRDDLLKREQFWIDRLNPDIPEIGYNILPIAGSRLGAKHTEEYKLKQSLRYKGKKRSAAAVEKTANSNRGKKRSDETKAKMSAWQKGRKLPDWHRKILSEAHKNSNKLFLNSENQIEF